jgi:hypothetical protein
VHFVDGGVLRSNAELQVSECQNVEKTSFRMPKCQDSECQNAEKQVVECQNAELQVSECQNVEKY